MSPSPDRPADRGSRPRGALGVLRKVKDQLREDNVPLLSAGVAFFLLLALFPALVAAVSVYALVADPADVQQQVARLADALPPSATSLVRDQLTDIVSSTSGGAGVGVILGLLGAVWAASSGMKHIVTAVNAAYDQPENRGFLRLRGLSVVLTLGGLVLFLLAVAVVAVLPGVVAATGLDGGVGALVRWAPYALLAVGFVVALGIVYGYAPNRPAPPWPRRLWGATTATVLWLVGTALFSLYVSQFGSYNETYGSIGAVIVLLLWLVLTAFTVLLGAELNAVLEQHGGDAASGEEETAEAEERQREPAGQAAG